MTQEEIDKLVEMTDMVALVSRYVPLEKQGKNYQGLCPFHSEKTPSFVVSPDKRLATCFGCHKGGGPLKFIQEIENVSFKDALRILSEFNGVEFKDEPRKENPNQKYYKIMDTSNKFYSKYLFNTKKGLDARFYLNNRGMDDKLMEEFGVGLSPMPGDSLFQVLSESGYLEIDMYDCGLVDKFDGSKKYHDVFSNRIMFPIKDEMGNTVAYSARMYEGDSTKERKYLNSKDSKIFSKGDVLYNLHLAKRSINKRNRVILHEGQMDVIAAYRSGLEEAVCTLGTGINERHVKMLSKYTDSVVICYDGDKAGRNSSVKAINLFQRANFKVHLVLLPNGMDPDEYVNKFGPEKYKEYFESNLLDSSEYLFNILFLDKNLSDKSVIDSLKQEAFSLIASFNSEMERETYLAKLSKSLDASLDATKSDFQSFMAYNAPQFNTDYPTVLPEYVEQYEEPIAITPKKTYNSVGELRIFGYAKRNKALAMQIDEELTNDLEGLSPENQMLWNALIYKYYMNFETFNDGLFVRSLSNEEMNQYLIVNEVLRCDLTPYDSNDLTKCIEKIKQQKLDFMNERLIKNAKSSGNENEKYKLLEQVFKNKSKKVKSKKSQEV